MANTLKFGNGEWYGKKDTILAYNDLNSNYKPLPFDFSRGSSATVVNKDGLIERVGSGEPRIDYKDDSKGALLLEPSRTNLLPYSNDFSQWSNNNVVSSNTFISPDGTLNASTLSKASAFSQIGLSANNAFVGQVYTFSVFVKINTTNYISLRVGGGANDVRKTINLITKTVTNGAGANQSGFINSNIENFNNDWYKVSITVTGDATTLNCNIYAGEVGNTTNDGLIDIYGTQLEQGSYPTSYIPTQGGVVTRLADVCNNAGNDQVINSTEGVLYAEISALANDETLRKVQVNDNTGNNNITIDYYTSSNSIRANLWNGSSQYSYIHTLTDVTLSIKVAFLYKSSEFKFYVNGIKVNESSSGSTFSSGTLKTLDLSTSNGSFPFYGNIKDIKLYNTALSDQELQALTTI